MTTGYCPHCGRGDCSPTADQWAEQKQRADKAEAAIARVRAIHAPGRDWSWKPFGCEHHGAHAQPCAHCGVCSPCPTLAALDGTT